ncbi:MAG TPA: transporter [Myxococcota bacterium]|nr:transporter [Myxococcota bacterium]
MLALALCCPIAAFADEDQPIWRLSTSYNFLKGDYGTHADAEITYIPVTFGVQLDGFKAGLTVPYLRQTSQDVVVTGGGVAVNKNKPPQTPAGPVKSTEDGLGDVLLRTSYVVLEERDERPLLPEVEPYLKIKFPTADDERGLGTGEFDETIGVDLSKSFLERASAYLTLAYTFIGEPHGVNLHDTFAGSIGAAYALARPFSVFAFFDGATAISPGQDDPLELRVGAEYRVAKFLKLTASGMKGLSDGSADWGATAGLALRF